MKPCPYCGEQIQDVAIKCRFCGEWLDPEKKVSSGSGEIDYSRLAREVARQLGQGDAPLEMRGLIPLEADAPAAPVAAEGRNARAEPVPRLGVPAPATRWDPPGGGQVQGEGWVPPRDENGGSWEPPPWLKDAPGDVPQSAQQAVTRAEPRVQESEPEPSRRRSKSEEKAALGELSGRMDKLKETASEVRRTIEGPDPSDEPAQARDADDRRTAVRPAVRAVPLDDGDADEVEDDIRDRKSTAPLTEEARGPDVRERPLPVAEERPARVRRDSDLDTFERGFLGGQAEVDEDEPGVSFVVSGGPLRKIPVIPIAAGLVVVAVVAFVYRGPLFGIGAADATTTAQADETKVAEAKAPEEPPPETEEKAEAKEEPPPEENEAGETDTGEDSKAAVEPGPGPSEKPPGPTQPTPTPTPPAEDDPAFVEKLEAARGLYRRKKYDDTVAALDEAFAVTPNHPDGLMLLSAVQLDQGKLPEALTTARRCVEVDAATADCWLTIAVLEKENKNLAPSLEAFRRYVELSPDGQYAKTAKRAIKELEREVG